MDIGQTIKGFRKKRSLSQVELAKKMKIAPASLSQIESGKKRAGPKMIKRLSKALDVPEPLIYLLSTEENDIADKKKQLFKLLFPTIKGLVNQILDEVDA
jgi:transcriptional regulator with XRE-family HTH domain